MTEDTRIIVCRIDKQLRQNFCKGRNNARLVVFEATLLNGSAETVELKCYLYRNTGPTMLYRIEPGTIAKMRVINTNDGYKVAEVFDVVRTTNTLTNAFRAYEAMCASANIEHTPAERTCLRDMLSDHKSLRHTNLTLACMLAGELGYALKLDGLRTLEHVKQNMAHLFSHMSGLVLNRSECAKVFETFARAALA